MREIKTYATSVLVAVILGLISVEIDKTVGVEAPAGDRVGKDDLFYPEGQGFWDRKDKRVKRRVKLDSCRLPHGFKLIRNNSKYIYRSPFNPTRATPYQIHRICNSSGFILPETGHSVDFRSLQQFFRTLKLKRTPFVPTGNRYDDYKSRGTLVTSGGKEAFIVWNTYLEPNTRTELKVSFLPIKYDKKVYLVGYDENYASKEYRGVLCQYPTYTSCFKNSFEETEYAKDSSQDDVLVPLGQGSYNIISGPKSVQTANELCAANGLETWLGKPKVRASTITRVRDAYVTTLRNILDLYPLAGFHTQYLKEKDVGKATKGVWNGDKDQGHFQLAQHIHWENSPFMAICHNGSDLEEAEPTTTELTPTEKARRTTEITPTKEKARPTTETVITKLLTSPPTRRPRPRPPPRVQRPRTPKPPPQKPSLNYRQVKE